MVKDYKKLNLIIVSLLGIGIIFFVLLRILFPSYEYRLNVKDSYGLGVLKYAINDSGYLVSRPLYDHKYNAIEVEMKGENLEKMGEVNSFEVIKAHVANLFPIGDNIESIERLNELRKKNNGSEIQNGELVSMNDAVYFVSDGKLRPFLGPEIFDALGFEWNDVIEIDEDGIGPLREGDKITLASSHPEGTILCEQKENCFLIWESKRLPIVGKELIELVHQEIPTVKIGNILEANIGVCEIGEVSSKKVSCEIILEDGSENKIGNYYIISIDISDINMIKDAKMKYVTLGLWDLDVLKTTGRVILGRAIEKYNPLLLR